MPRGDSVGIIIHREASTQNRLSVFFFGRYINYTLRVGRYTDRRPEELFAPAPVLHGFIQNGTIQLGQQLGTMQYIKFRRTHHIESHSFFPFGPFEELKHRGMGSLVELQIERQLEREYPNYSIEHSTEMYPDRQKQMRNRGIQAGERIPIHLARMATQRQVVRNYRKNRPSVK